LDNIPNIQSSWVTQRAKIGQLALLFGANDMGSLTIEENVVASAGTVHYLTLEQIKSNIRELGWIPRQRNVFYELLEEQQPLAALRPASEMGRGGEGVDGFELMPRDYCLWGMTQSGRIRE
jgi:cyclic dehypoxanthinyl futalosine synthase